MSIILKHVVRNIREKKFRTLILLLSIFLSTAVLFAGLSLNSVINETYSKMLQGVYGNTNIVLKKNGDAPFYAPSDIMLDSVSIGQRIDQLYMNGKWKSADKDVRVSLCGMNVEQAKDAELVSPLRQLDGYGSDETMIMISQKTASDYGLNLGDAIEIEHSLGNETFTIGAISETNGIFYSETGQILLVTSLDELNRIYGMDKAVNQTLIQVPKDELDKAINTLADQNVHFTVQQTNAADTLVRDEETFQITMMLAIIIIVLISAYVISTLSKLILAERMPVIGTFRSIGFSKRMMNRVILLEFFVYGLLGSTLGVVFAYIILPYTASIFNEYKEYDVKLVTDLPLSQLTIAYLFGLLFPVGINFLRIHKANSTPLKDLILNTQHVSQQHSRITTMIGISFLGAAFILYYLNNTDHLLMAIFSVLCLFISIVLLTPRMLNGLSNLFHLFVKQTRSGNLILSTKNIANNKIVSNNSSMIIVVLLLLLMVGMVSSGIDQFLTNSFKKDFDVTVRGSEGGELEPGLIENVKAMDEVSRTYYDHVSLAEYQVNGNRETFSVHGVDDIREFDTFYSGITLLGDAETKMKEVRNGIIIDEYQLDKYDLKIGETILLQPLDDNFQPLADGFIEVVISGAMESSAFSQNRNTVLIHQEYFAQHFDGFFNQLSVKIKDEDKAEDVKEAIADQFMDTPITVMTFDEMIASQKATIDTLINGIKVIIAMGLVVGLLGISNNLLVSFSQRKKQYAVLYSVCMSRMQIIRMLFWEMFITFIAVVMISLLGGLALNKLMTKLLYAIGLRIEYQFTFELFGILCAFVFILLILSTIPVARQVFKLNMMKELRYE
ncbi:FtsX-like permease family protein [Siminovitchia sp. FSL H7-0308]|uniref:ABC-type antimicrobial peptide transport system permease subunit n=1 Tax=Siminovitchia thermophila TaxID=1245522 RepID=A0ABS2R1Z1_9BACI|nr:ABC transporter permease [Siminovitchia thermophila]MBM7713658.1 ABC-type antimicrobial peptide transport system permease subunit [Siminovitchia thermophila]